MFNKIFGNKIQQAAQTAINAAKKEEPVFRFKTSGWQQMGAQTRPQDTRTPAQIDATIDALTEKIPAVKEFREQIKTLNPKHRALVADTLEMADTYELLMTPIDMVKHKASDGKTVIQVLLSKFLKASKENPEALKFTQAVINNTDTQTSKYLLTRFAGFSPEAMLARRENMGLVARYEANMSGFKTTEEFNQYTEKRIKQFEEDSNTFLDALAHYAADSKGIKNYQEYRNYISKTINELKDSSMIKNDYVENTILDTPEAGKYMDMSIPFVKPVAESTINGMYLGTFEKQSKFLKTMEGFFNTDATPEKLSALASYNDSMNRMYRSNRLEAGIINAFIETKTPITQLRYNIAQLPQAIETAEKRGQSFNPLPYVMYNVNFVKPKPKIDLSKGIKYAPTELQK